MIFARSLWQHPEFKRGGKDMLAVALGTSAWGLMTGVAMVNSGMGVFTALLMTFTVFAGSAQLAATPLLAAGAPMWVVLATAFCVNLRFVVFSMHLRPYMMHLPLRWRLVTGYLTGDLNYVMLVSAHPKPATTTIGKHDQWAYLMGANWVNYITWMASSVIGIALAAYIPIEWGLGFAGILALLGITCALTTSKLRVLAVVVSGAAAVAAYAMPLKLNILVAIAAAVVVCLVTESVIAARRQHLNEEHRS